MSECQYYDVRAIDRPLTSSQPSGYRVEGLDVETVVALLARLAVITPSSSAFLLTA